MNTKNKPIEISSADFDRELKKAQDSFPRFEDIKDTLEKFATDPGAAVAELAKALENKAAPAQTETKAIENKLGYSITAVNELPVPCALPSLPEALKRLHAVKKDMCNSFIERDSVVHGMLVALLAKQHCFIGGPPGTGKSDIVREFSNCVADQSYFEILLTKFSTPEEVYGPISYTQLKQDKYIRLTKGYAPSAKVAFFDEIWKGSSAILNCNLSMLSDKIFHNGGQAQKVPLEILTGASNEYPSDENEAMYDRFNFRFWVNPIANRKKLFKLVQAGERAPVTARLMPGDLEVLRAAAKAMPISDRIANDLESIDRALTEAGYTSSDRTWIHSGHILRANAIISGRSEITGADLLILSDCLWRRHSDRPAMATIIGKIADPWLAKSEAITDAIRSAMAEVPDLSEVKRGIKDPQKALLEMGKVSGKVRSQLALVLTHLAESPNNPALIEVRDYAEQCEKDNKALMYKIAEIRPVKQD